MERCKELEEDIEMLEADLEDTQADRDKYLVELTNLKAKQIK
jgi:seryl-tRNA synthetase